MRVMMKTFAPRSCSTLVVKAKPVGAGDGMEADGAANMIKSCRSQTPLPKHQHILSESFCQTNHSCKVRFKRMGRISGNPTQILEGILVCVFLCVFFFFFFLFTYSKLVPLLRSSVCDLKFALSILS